MGIVSIGEVVGEVQAGPSEPAQASSEGAPGAQEHATLMTPQAEELERELRVRAWRQTRLQAD